MFVMRVRQRLLYSHMDRTCFNQLTKMLDAFLYRMGFDIAAVTNTTST